jgi:fucose permease
MAASRARSPLLIGIVFLIFFVVSLLTNITGPLVPDVIRSFHLSLTMAAFLPFSFFLAYALISIPSGMIIERWREKPMLIAAFSLALCGSLLFALLPLYPTALLSLFFIGLGMATLQVAINPLLRVAGGEEHFAFNSVMGQLIFGLASFLSPLLYSHFTITLARQGAADKSLLGGLLAQVVPQNLAWTAVYWLFALITFAMVFIVSISRFPRVELREEEKSGAWATHAQLLTRPVVWLYFAAIFCYVGLEQSLSNWMSQYLSSQHGLSPQVDGARAVSRFWGLMTVGCAVGLVLLKFFDSKRVLLAFSALAIGTVTAAIFGPKEWAVMAFPASGFALSVMWSIIFSLALNSLPTHHGAFSGILCTGIVGGAVLPLAIGGLGDHVGLRGGLCLVYIPLIYILSIGLWARPLVRNRTFSTERT